MASVIKTTRVQPVTGDVGAPRTDALDEVTELAAAGERVAGRYQLFSALGRGGHGEVWEALDTLSSERVAVKILPAVRTPLRVRNEVSALRLLQVPGVVRLFDEGIDRGRPFLVMERVRGEPFPGAARKWTWESLAQPTTALLETLARTHAAGVVHRDIKPGNVLVNAEGRPTLLDFGLAFAAPWDSVADRAMAGTPAYMAPEQMAGESAEPRSDLYSVGVMLYEALTGSLPFENLTLYALVFAKANEDLRPVRELVPALPVEVAQTIDRMVARDPSRRPASASEVLRMLRGERATRRMLDALPALGDGAAVRALCERVRAGRSVDVVGPRGSGRTWALAALSEALAADGRAVVAVTPARKKFPTVPGSAREAGAALGALLREGAVLVADDAELLDGPTAAALAEGRRAGVVVRALLPEQATGGDEEVWLKPLDEAALRSIFVGHERVFHLPSDAARVLWDCSEAWPARVATEVSAWVRAGLARRDGPRVAVDRESLDRLAAGQRLGPVTKCAASGALSMLPRPRLSRPHEELLTWIALAWPHTATTTLAAATGREASAVVADAAALEEAGAARRHESGRWAPVVPVVVEAVWDETQRAEAHRAMARVLPAGTEGRLVHLVAGAAGDDGDAAAIAREAVALAEARRAEGRLGLGLAALAEGLMAARRAGPLGLAEQEVLVHWVEAALDEGTPRALDRVRYELSRAVTTRLVEALTTLVEAAQAARAGGERGLDMVEALGPFEATGLEMRRLNVRVTAARRSTLAREARAVEEATRWAATVRDAQAAGIAAEWVGRLRYREGRYAEAAELLVEASRREPDPTRRLSFKRGVAVQLIEMHRHEAARQWAVEVRDEAMALRNPAAECFGEYLLRVVAYRTDTAGGVDLELVEASRALGVADIDALVSFTEGVVAWRAGDAVAGESLGRAQGIWAATGWRWGAMLARAVAWRPEAEGAEVEQHALAMAAEGCELPGVAIQTVGLLARASGQGESGWRATARRCVEALGGLSPTVRLEVLSVAECLEALGM